MCLQATNFTQSLFYIIFKLFFNHYYSYILQIAHQQQSHAGKTYNPKYVFDMHYYDLENMS